MPEVIRLATRRRAAPVAATSKNDLVHLHMAAVNALSHALRQLTGPDCSPSGWATATAKAHRGLSALKQGCTLLQQGGEG